LIHLFIYNSYYAPVDDIRKEIRRIDDSNEDPEYLPHISDKLRSLVDMPKKPDITTIDFNSKFERIENKIKEGEKDLMKQIQSLKNEINDFKK